jgi:3-hydroxybutyryl-CoA dehydrogenase
VIESVIEELSAKESLFNQLEEVIRADVPVASNTSSIPITELQSKRLHPERFLGMHWAEPAYSSRFLELVRGEMTSEATFEVAEALAWHIGKEPSLVQKDVPAFIVNRLGYAMYREAMHILELGVADVETIDRSFRNACGLWATICGPFRWIDLTGGPALYGKALQRVWPTLSDATEIPDTLKLLMEDDAQGIVNGRGFYRYTKAEARDWQNLLHEHAWNVRALMDVYFPLDNREEKS